MEEYHYVGYLLYVLLFGAAVTGGSIAVLMPFRRIESLREVIPNLVTQLTLSSSGCYLGFAAIVTYRIAVSNLIM